MSDVCRRCKAPILWATTDHGAPIPLDPTPTTDGNIALVHLGTGAVVAITLKTRELARLAGERELYMTHFATCPFADEFRKTRS